MTENTAFGPTAPGARAGGGPSRDPLAACLSLSPDLDLASHLASLAPADWRRLVDRARRHEVAALVGRRLEERAPDEVVPASVRRELGEAYDRLTGDNARLYEELALLGRRLAAAEVPVIALKGTHLAEALYGDVGLRAMLDIDLLVPDEACRRTDEVLRGLGYEAVEPSSVYEFNGHMPPYLKDGATPVEVHFTLEARGKGLDGGTPVVPFPVDVEAVWRRAVPTRLGGTDFLALSWEDLALHLCQHLGFNHGFNVSLKHVCDIGWLVHRRGADLDWSRLSREARRRNAGRIVHAVLRAVAEILDVDMPLADLGLTQYARSDRRVHDAIAAHILVHPRRGSLEERETRAAIDPWLLAVTGTRGRH